MRKKTIGTNNIHYYATLYSDKKVVYLSFKWTNNIGVRFADTEGEKIIIAET